MVPDDRAGVGFGRQGCLTLTGPDGTAKDIWIRNPKDLRRVLGLATPVGKV